LKKIIIGLIVALVAVTGLYFVFADDSSSQEEPAQTSSQSTSKVVEVPAKEQPAGAKKATVSGYVDYSEDNLKNSAGTKQVVFFHAKWCSTCKFFEGQIKAGEVPAGVTILQADFDTESDLKEKYGVIVQSTFVLLDKNGEVDKQWPFAAGLKGINDLYSQI
jgi:thiol:disulfide interchange protein